MSGTWNLLGLLYFRIFCFHLLISMHWIKTYADIAHRGNTKFFSLNKVSWCTYFYRSYRDDVGITRYYSLEDSKRHTRSARHSNSECRAPATANHSDPRLTPEPANSFVKSFCEFTALVTSTLSPTVFPSWDRRRPDQTCTLVRQRDYSGAQRGRRRRICNERGGGRDKAERVKEALLPPPPLSLSLSLSLSFALKLQPRNSQ